MKKYYSAICLIIRDENEYLQEWVRHHLSIGYEHFYIYDNNSRIPISETVKTRFKKAEREKITVVDWSGKYEYAQLEAYRHCLNTYGKETEWLTIIDADEFVVLNKDSSINDFLKRYEYAGGVCAGWKLFNANGQVKQLPGSLMERFTQESPKTWESTLVKTTVRTDVTNEIGIHNSSYKGGYCTVSESGEPVDDVRADVSKEYIQINHYYTKSWEEWKKKIFRGVADTRYRRKFRDFFENNPDMKYLDKGFYTKQEYNITNAQ